MSNQESKVELNKGQLFTAKEVYLLFKNFYDNKSWSSYPVWEKLSESEVQFWYDFVKIVYDKYFEE